MSTPAPALDAAALDAAALDAAALGAAVRGRFTAAVVALRAARQGEAAIDLAGLAGNLGGQDPDGDVRLGWARWYGLSADLLDHAVRTGDDWLLELAGRIEAVAAVPPHVPGPPPVLVRGPDGRPVAVELVRRIPQPTDDRWWRPLDGLRAPCVAAEEAVAAVLAPLGLTLPAAGPWCAWWPLGVGSSDAAIALPVALQLLTEQAALTEPPLATGAWDGTRFVAPAEEVVDELQVVARDLGRALLVPQERGWRRYPVDGEPCDLSGRPTLERAAALAWGEDWEGWKRAQHADRVVARGWWIVDPTVTPRNQPVPDVDVRQVEKLVSISTKGPWPRIAVLGGHPGSGRSATVRRLAHRLHDVRQPFDVVVVSRGADQLPSEEMLTAVVRHAVGAGRRSAERLLVVVEDLLPTGDGRVGDLLRTVAGTLATDQGRDVVVLGVLGYDDESQVDWVTDGIETVTAAVNEPGRRAFIDDLARNGTGLDPLPAITDLDRKAGMPSLRRITELMAGAPRPELAATFTGQPSSLRRAVATVAALTLVCADAAAEPLADLGEADRLTFGLPVNRRSGRLRIDDPDDCTVLVGLHGGKWRPGDGSGVRRPTRRQLVEPMTELLAEEVRRACLMVGDAQPLDLLRLLRGARLFSADLCRRLLRKVGTDLVEWTAAAPLAELARLLLAFGTLLEDDPLKDAVGQLAARLPAAVVPTGDVFAVVDGLVDWYQLLVQAEQARVHEWICDAVTRVLDDPVATPDQRYAVVSRAAWLRVPKIDELLARRAVDVLHGVRVEAPNDYRLVRRVHRLQSRAERRADTEVPPIPVDQETPVRKMLERVPRPENGIEVLVESMILRRTYDRGDWDTVLAEHQDCLPGTLSSCTAAQLAGSLRELRAVEPHYATSLLNKWRDFPNGVRGLLGRGSATDAASLLTTIADVHAGTAFDVLHDPGGHPFGALATTLARRLDDDGDVKGAGLLLSAARRVDDLFRTGEQSFALELADRIGPKWTLDTVGLDPRLSSRYYLVKGLWDAGAGFRADCLDSVLDMVVRAVRRARKHWGAAIALRLGADPELGARSLARLRDRLDNRVLLAAVNGSSTAHAQAVHHRLGRALHPDFPEAYKRDWTLDLFVDRLSTSAPAAAVEACVEAAATLVEADVPDAGPQIVRATGGVEGWKQRLRPGRNSPAFTAAVEGLTRLDPEVAAAVVTSLMRMRGHTEIAGQPATLLQERARRALYEEPAVAPALLAAVDGARPGTGRELLDVASRDVNGFRIFRSELQQLQHPMTQSAAMRQLVRVGMSRRSSGTEWVDQLYKARRQSIFRLRSPRALHDLLRMLSAWEPRWPEVAAEGIDVAAVARRLSARLPDDLAPAVGLLRTLCAVGQRTTAAPLVDALLSADHLRVATQLDLHSAAALVDLLRSVDPPLALQFARTMWEAVDATIRQPLVRGEREMWLGVGRFAQTSSRLGIAPRPVGRPRLSPNSVHAASVAWAARGLADQEWTEKMLVDAELRLRTHPGRRDGLDQACVLAATGDGWAPALRTAPSVPRGSTQAGPDRFWDVSAAPLWMLRVLYEQETADPFLTPVLKRVEPEVRRRIDAPLARSNWDAHQLRQLLTPVLVAASSGTSTG